MTYLNGWILNLHFLIHNIVFDSFATLYHGPSHEKSISTYATSGKISTPYFEENFKDEKFNNYQLYNVKIVTPYADIGLSKEDSFYGRPLFDRKYEINIECDIMKKFEVKAAR